MPNRGSRKAWTAVLGAGLVAAGVVLWLVLPARKTKTWTVQRQKLHLKIVERGFLEAVDKSEVFCRVRSRTPGSLVATRIKWLVEDGATVKKGDKLAELDDSHLQAAHKSQEALVHAAQANWTRAPEEYTAQVKKIHEDVKKALDDKRLTVPAREQAKKLAASREIQADSVRRSKKLIYEQELAKQHALEKDIAQCILYAPRAGFVLHYVPEEVAKRLDIVVAVGEPVSEGQRLMLVCDLKRMQVKTQVREALRAYIRPGQNAEVRLDAYPGRILQGRLAHLGRAPSPLDSISAYPAVVTIDSVPEEIELRPEMSAQVTLPGETSDEVLVVPLEALHGLVDVGQTCTCFVMGAAGQPEEREVVLGVHNDHLAAVQVGLEEGETVVLEHR